MTRRNERAGGGVLALVLGATALATSCTVEPPPEEGPARHPNLLIVMPDQWRGQALGFLNEDPVVTPTLDALAGEGLVLSNAVANYPVCSPARAMLMTGQYPHTNGVLGNANSATTEYGYQLRVSTRTWSDILADEGYSLGYIGKWHLESPHEPFVESYNNSPEFAWNEWAPPERRHGFDFWYAYNTYDRHLKPRYWATDSTRDESFTVDAWGPEHEADVAIRYIRNDGGEYREEARPFALVVAMNPPHMPYDHFPPRYLAPYEGKTHRDLLVRPNVDFEGDSDMAVLARTHTKNYFAMMTGVDEQFGRILAALDDEGLAEDTIVVFTSDHGNCLGTHGEVSKNNHYEESMRVPLLVRWPGKIRPRRDDLLISYPDIPATLIDLMGFADARPAEMEGTSHASLFLSGDGDRPTSQLYLWVPNGEPGWGRRGVRTDRYTLMISKMPGEPRRTVLHDNLEDPYQLENIAERSPEVVQRLVREELEPWLRRTDDPGRAERRWRGWCSDPARSAWIASTVSSVPWIPSVPVRESASLPRRGGPLRAERAGALPAARAAGGSHAPAQLRRVLRAGGAGWRGALSAAGGRVGSAQVVDLLGPPWHRQDHAGSHRRRHDRASLRGRVGGDGRRCRHPAHSRGGARRGSLRGARHDPVHRRDPSLQQVAAGCAAARRRGRHPDADRRHHRKPLVRGQLRVAEPHAGSRARGAVGRVAGAGTRRGPERQRARPRRRAADPDRRGPRGVDLAGPRRRSHAAELPRARRAPRRVAGNEHHRRRDDPRGGRSPRDPLRQDRRRALQRPSAPSSSRCAARIPTPPCITSPA